MSARRAPAGATAPAALALTVSADERDALKNALTLAVVQVEQRVEALRSEWRAMSVREQNAMPGLEEQIARERAALALIERLRDQAYRSF